MAKLNAKKRNALPDSDFALPRQRKYPVNNKSHAENALARATNKSPAVKAAVDRKVHAKFPGMGKSKKGAKMVRAAMKERHNAIGNHDGYTL